MTKSSFFSQLLLHPVLMIFIMANCLSLDTELNSPCIMLHEPNQNLSGQTYLSYFLMI